MTDDQWVARKPARPAKAVKKPGARTTEGVLKTLQERRQQTVDKRAEAAVPSPRTEMFTRKKRALEKSGLLEPATWPDRSEMQTRKKKAERPI